MHNVVKTKPDVFSQPRMILSQMSDGPFTLRGAPIYQAVSTKGLLLLTSGWLNHRCDWGMDK